MLEYYSQVTQTEDIVNETSMKVFSMSYLDDSEDDMTLPYNVNNFLLGAVASVTIANNKLEVNKYESSDLEVVTLRQLKHALSGKVKDITYENNVLRVVNFERSDLTGLQTKAAIVSLLTNVVSDVRVVGNELVVERWSAADVANGITRMEFEPHIAVTATNPYMLSGETTDLVVSLVDGFGSPVDGELVTIGQSIFRDNGTTANPNDIWILSNATLTRNASDSTLLKTTATGYAMSDQYHKIPPNSVVEFDICQTDGSVSYAPIYIRNDGGGVSLSTISYSNLGASIGEWVHIKIVFNNTDTITVYSDKLSESFTKTLSATSTNYRMMLYCGRNMTTIKFKNYVVYETSNGVTDENGEFALQDVSVTDDTTFTATYETVSDSVDVFLCTSVDYATSNKNTSMWTLSNFTLSRGDSYSILTEGSGTGTCTSDSSHKIAPTQTISFDLCQMDGTKYYAPIYIRNDGGGASLASITYNDLNANVGDWVHMKIVFNNTSTITIYADTLAEPITKTLSATSTNYRLMFYGNNIITTLYFKNVAIY